MRSEIEVLQFLRNILNSQCSSSTDCQFYLKEESASSRLSKVLLTEIPSGCLVFPLDEARRKPCSKCGREQKFVISFVAECSFTKAHRLVDYAILKVENGGNYTCYLIEIKSKSADGALDQFTGARCAINYLADLLRTQAQFDFTISNFVYVIVQGVRGGGSFYKRPIGQIARSGDSPPMIKRLIKRDGETLRFSELRK